MTKAAVYIEFALPTLDAAMLVGDDLASMKVAATSQVASNCEDLHGMSQCSGSGSDGQKPLFTGWRRDGC